jgi:putative peptidoglycan lipid II flippase
MTSNRASTTVIRGTAIVGGLTLLSRMLGMFRDLLFASLFGASAIADAFFVAFRIPNILRSFVAEGALTSAFVPVFSTDLRKNDEQAQQTLESVTSLLCCITAVLTILGVALAPFWVTLFAPGFARDSEQQQMCVWLLRIMMPYIMFVSLVAMLNGALNTLKVFGAAAMAQVVMNIVLIAGAGIAFFTSDSERAFTIAIAVIIGGLMQVLVQIPALKRGGFQFRFSTKLITSSTREILWLMAPAIVGAAIYQLSMLANTILASLLETGSVSWLFYADRLAQLPIGIFSVALASVLLPTLSNAMASDNTEEFRSNFINALRYTSFVIIPTAFGLAALAPALVSVLFERGAFGATSTAKTALAVQMLCIGLWGVSCHSMTVRAFIARKDTRTPTIFGALTLILSICCALLFMGPISVIPDQPITVVIHALQSGPLSIFPSTSLGHAGLALATGLATTISFLALALALSQRIPELDWLPFLRCSARSLIAGSVMYAVVIQVIATLSPAMQLIVGIPCGALTYSILSFLTKSSELQETFALLVRKTR